MTHILLSPKIAAQAFAAGKIGAAEFIEAVPFLTFPKSDTNPNIKALASRLLGKRESTIAANMKRHAADEGHIGRLPASPSSDKSREEAKISLAERHAAIDAVITSALSEGPLSALAIALASNRSHGAIANALKRLHTQGRVSLTGSGNAKKWRTNALSFGESRMITFIRANPQCTLKQVCDALQISKSAAKTQAETLARTGKITRHKEAQQWRLEVAT